MLSLRISSTHLPLPKSFALGFNFITNVLNISEKIDPSFSLPITVPNTEEVSELFGYGHEATSDFDLSQTFEDCAVMLNGNDYWPGAIEIASGDDDEFRLNFRFASGYIPTVNEKQTLKELFEDVAINITGGTTRTYTLVWPTDPRLRYDMSVNAGSYYEIVLSEFDDMADYLTDLALQIDGRADVYSATFDTDTYVMTVVGVANATLVISASSTLDLGEGVTQVENVSPIPVTTAFNISFPDLGTIYQLPTMYIPNLFDGASYEYTGFVNLFSNGNYVYDKPDHPADAFTTIIPRIRTKWMLQYLFGLFNIEIEGTYLSHSEWSNRLEFVPRPIHKEVYDNEFEDTLDIEIPVAEFLPDISLSDWLLSLKAEACMSITFNSGEKIASLNLVKEVLNDSAYEDWTAYLVDFETTSQIKFNGLQLGYDLNADDLRVKDHARKRDTFGNVKTAVANMAALLAIDDDETNAIRFVISKNAYYRWMRITSLALENTWEFWSYNLDDYTEGNEGVKVKSAYTPLVNDLITYEGDWTSTMWLPHVDVTGYMPQLGLNNNSFPPRFDIYRGLQKDIEDVNYPMSSIGIHKADETAIAGATLCLSPAVHPANKTDLLFSEWILQQKDNKRFTATFNLPIGMLEKINPIRKIRVRDVNFLVESHSGEITRGGLNLVQSILIRT